ncbi:MAG: rhodanese-like domain-containing protein [Agathobacter sp.]|nr:rhodanese-like domain-containing protein [Agathobacter sp.]MBQ6811887.1 rhodanese-like domain-containing protein [Agathobacter sp.]
MKKQHYLGAILLIMAILTACTNNTEQNSNQDVGQSDTQLAATYECITQEEAHALMEDGIDCIILDVRTQEEYDEKHILNAICIPNETIGTEPPAELPDKDQLILVYCRSGNRSKQASEKLAAMGYTNIKEFGGINTWTGATVSHKE